MSGTRNVTIDSMEDAVLPDIGRATDDDAALPAIVRKDVKIEIEREPDQTPEKYQSEHLSLVLDDSEKDVEKRLTACHLFIKEIVDRFAKGNGNNFSSAGIAGQFNFSQRFASTSEEPKLIAWNSLLIKISLLYYKKDKGDTPSVTSANITTQKGYSKKNTIARLKKEVFGIEQEEIPKEYQSEHLALFLNDSEKDVAKRLNAYHLFLKEIVTRFAGGDGKKISSDGIAGQLKLNQRFASTGKNPELKGWGSLLTKASLLYYEKDNGATKGVNTATIATQKGYNKKHIVARLKKEVFNIEFEEEPKEVSEKYQSKHLSLVLNDSEKDGEKRLTACHLFIKEIVDRFAKGNGNTFSSEGIPNQFNASERFASTDADPTIATWQTLLTKASLLYHRRDHGETDEVKATNVFRQEGYSRKEIVRRLKKDIFNIEQEEVSKEYRSEHLTIFLDDSEKNVAKRLNAYHLFIKEVVARFANGDIDKFSSSGIAGQFKNNQLFASTGETIKVSSWNALLKKASLLYYAQDNEEIKGVNSNNIGQKEGYSVGNIAARLKKDIFNIQTYRTKGEKVSAAKRVVHDSIKNLHDLLGEEDFKTIASRFSLPLIQVAYLVSAKSLNGIVDEKLLRNLVEGEVLSLFERKKTDETVLSYEDNTPTSVIHSESPPPSKESLRTLAQRLDEISELESIFSELELEQAVLGISRLEEERLLADWVGKGKNFYDIWDGLSSEIEESESMVLKTALNIVADRVERAERLSSEWNDYFLEPSPSPSASFNRRRT